MKHTTINLDPNEQTAARYRLYSRAIRIIGMAQISALQPYLQARLQETLHKHIDARDSTNGRTSLLILPFHGADDSRRLDQPPTRSFHEGLSRRHAGTVFLWAEAL